MPRWRLTLVLATLAALVAGAASAQSLRQGFTRGPNDNQPDLPAPEFLPQQRPGFELPPAPEPRQPGLASGKSLMVKDIVIEGNTVLPQARPRRHRRPL